MSTTEQRRHEAAFRRMGIVDRAASRLSDGLDALAAAAGNSGGQIDAAQVAWFCQALKSDALLCLRVADPNETDEELEELAA